MLGKEIPDAEPAQPDIQIDAYLAKTGALPTIAEDVRRGLTTTPKTLPPKYFYDDRGSRLFEEITRTPEYYLTRTETELLRRVARDVVSRLRPGDLVELGPGSSTKTREILDAMQEAGVLERYVPVDVSRGMVEAAAARLAEAYPGLRIEGVVGDFLHHLDKIPEGERHLVIFLGSTIGNLPMDEARGFLASIADAMGPDDGFLLGADLVKDRAILEAAYNDAQGVTAEFNRNILRVVNRHLDADFDPERFAHVSFFNADLQRIESYLEAREAHTVVVRKLDLSIRFARGERIHTESSQKYTRERLTSLLEGAGMRLQEFYTDRRGWYSLSLAVRAPA